MNKWAQMKKYSELDVFDLLAIVEIIKPAICGRVNALFSGYRGQFFWHINDVACSDWLATYFFESGQLEPGEQGLCKVMLGDSVKAAANCNFPVGSQFAIREGSIIVAIGKILESHSYE